MKKDSDMRAFTLIAAGLLLATLPGCIGQAVDERNPFLTATEAFGASALGADEDDDTAAAGVELEAEFRQVMTVTLANNHPTAELNTSFAAWVSPNSIRSGEQQDELIANGFVQLNTTVELGTAFTLVPGTFVYNGPGVAGATSVRLMPTRASEEEAIDPALATLREFEIVTPDVILIFSQPPVSCDSVGFYFTIDGDPITSEGLSGVGNVFAGPSSQFGGLKTLSLIDAYECDPFHPGLFLRVGGGTPSDNEFFEGQNIRIDFSPVSDAAGFFATVSKTDP
jgi:hypothetical protein